MKRELRLVAILISPLLLSGCLYTKGMVEERFHVQVLDCAGGAVTVDNRSGVPMELCSFGTTATFCQTSEIIEAGEARKLDYAMACTQRPIPDHPCSHDECLTVRRSGAELAPENSEFIEIGPPLGLHVSLRPDGFEGILDPVVVTNRVTSGDVCYRVLVLPPGAGDRRARELADDEEGVVLAMTRSDPVACD